MSASRVSSAEATISRTARPLLKWAGGKRQLLPQLRRFYPQEFATYLEPFLGSGAVFFDLHGSGRLEGRRVVLIDSNPDLIGCYEAVRRDPHGVADALEVLAAAHTRYGRAHYYDVRDGRFNPMRQARLQRDGTIAYTADLAAMLIYMNRTGFNGLFRVNRRGAFNVPAGRYDRPRIADRSRLIATAAALSGQEIRLVHGPFDAVDALARGGDFVYLDPPYAPLNRTSSFTAYTASAFGAEEQRRLQRLVIALAVRGCHVLMSNSTAAEITALYERDPEVARAGLRAERVPARRAVNSNAARRGVVDEYLITNIPARRS
jgi:DNA adenine methylase